MPTIAAIATPPGSGGIGIIRLSGPGAKALLARVFLPHGAHFENFRPYTLHRGILLDSRDAPLDDVLAVFMPGPRSYTGEDVAEVHCHGGALLVQRALESFLRLGARQADPGEFTRRAFLNGRMDLSQAEAVAELIAAPSREALGHGLARLEGRLTREVRALQEKVDALRALGAAAVDFPDEETEILDIAESAALAEDIVDAIGRLLKAGERAQLMAHGAVVALAGPVNAGKSSLLNALCGEDRALVTPLAGTTRDLIEVQLNFSGLPVRLIDTAGLRQSEDIVEKMGMGRALEMMAAADLILYVLDASCGDSHWRPEMDYVGKSILVWNKNDLTQPPEAPPWARDVPVCSVSALTGDNLDRLVEMVRERLLQPSGGTVPEGQAAPNVRQAGALRRAAGELTAFARHLRAGEPYDCCLTCLDAATSELGGIVSLAADDELLDIIFSKFCIGK